MAQGPSLSKSPPITPADSNPPGGLPLADCLREGFTQLKLVLLWIDYRAQLTLRRDKGDDHCKDLADRVMKEVIEPFLKLEWLPQLGEYAIKYKENPNQHRWLLDRLKTGSEDLIKKVMRSAPAGISPSKPLLVELIRTALKGEEPQTLPQSQGAPFLVSPKAAAEIWMAQGVALEAWARLEPDLIAIEKEYQFCDKLHHRKLDLDQLVKALERSKMPNLASDADEVAGKLDMYITMLRSNIGRTAGVIRSNERYEWHLAFEGTPEDWPPRVLATMAEDLRQFGGEPRKTTWLGGAIQAAQAPSRDTSPRLILAHWVLDGLDRIEEKVSLSKGIWNGVKRCLTEILGQPVTLIRSQAFDPSTAREWRAEIFDGPTGSLRRLRKTGLVLDGKSVVRRAEVQVAKDSGSPLAVPLEALRDAKSAGKLGELAGELRNLLTRSTTLEVKDPKDFVLIWQVLARSAVQPSPASGLVVDGLRDLGYSLEPAPELTKDRPIAPGWVAAIPVNGQTSPSPLTSADKPYFEVVALRVPGRKELILPTTWLKVPHPWFDKKGWLDVLLKHEAILLRIVESSNGGLSSSSLPELVRGLIAARTEGPLEQPHAPEAGAELAAEIFAAFFQEYLRLQSSRSAAEQARSKELYVIARDLYATFDPPTKQRVGILLKDDLTPDLKALTQVAQSNRLAVTWGGKADGVKILALTSGTNGNPAKITLTVPKSFDDRVMAWVNLPDPGNLLGDQSGSIHQRLTWLPAAEKPQLGAIQDDIRKVFQTDSALNALISEARRGDDASPSRVWLRRLLIDNVVKPIPSLEPKTLALAGTDDLDQCPELIWAFDKETAAGSIIESAPINFSTDPKRVKATLSYGRKTDRAWVDATIALQESLGSLPDRLSEALSPAIDRMIGLVKVALKSGSMEPPAEARVPLEDAFAALLRAAEPGIAAKCDEVAAQLRKLADSLKLAVRPSSWSFVAPPGSGQLDASEAVLEPDPLPRFLPSNPEAGKLVLKKFSVGNSPGHYAISCGPPPPHYEALRNALVAAGEIAAGLVAHLETWPASAQGGRLELEAIQFYLKFWGTLGTDFRRDSYEAFRLAEGTLGSLMSERFGLVKFEPSTIQDYPDGWMNVTAQGSLMTGRVARIGRPGLRTKDHMLRVAALVEIE